MTARVLQGNARKVLATLPENSVHCIVCSPPYYAQRKYKAGAQEMGSEATPEEHIAALVAVLRECRRVLRPDGTLWLNYGDKSAHGGPSGGPSAKQQSNTGSRDAGIIDPSGYRDGEFLQLPWKLALALREDGWVLHPEIIWCLSGGTWVYARTQKGDMPMMIRDMARLNPATVQLWNGKKWTRVLGISRTRRAATELELVLRSGERIACSPTHKFPTQRGLLPASEIVVGDRLQRVRLPEPSLPLVGLHVSEDAAWLAGLYIAEGSRYQGKISIAGHSKEIERWERIKAIAESYGGSATCTTEGNVQNVRVFGKLLNAIIDYLVSGKTASDKGFAPVVWRYSNKFIAAMVQGYLDGDGHWDEANHRWRLGFTRNYNLERDLRTACARLGWRLTLNARRVSYNGGTRPTFRGEIRISQSGHHNEKSDTEIVAIRKARSRFLYDIGVGDEPHVFALASGILTHNSKPAPMPESVSGTRWEQHRVKVNTLADRTHETGHRDYSAHLSSTPSTTWADCPGCAKCEPNGGLVLRRGSWRPTRAHEYIFMLTKTEDYYADMEAVRETGSENSHGGGKFHEKRYTIASGRNDGGFADFAKARPAGSTGRNLRSVWTIGPSPLRIPSGYTAPVDVAHFAAFPVELPTRCIKVSTSERGVCPTCGAPWARVIQRGKLVPDSPEYKPRGTPRPDSLVKRGLTPAGTDQGHPNFHYEQTTLAWRPTCACPDAPPVPAVVLDPFCGAGTTLLAAVRLGRDAIGIELRPEYAALTEKRLYEDAPLLAGETP